MQGKIGKCSAACCALFNELGVVIAAENPVQSMDVFASLFLYRRRHFLQLWPTCHSFRLACNLMFRWVAEFAGLAFRDLGIAVAGTNLIQRPEI